MYSFSSRLCLILRSILPLILSFAACSFSSASAQSFVFADRVDFAAKSGMASIVNAKGTLSTRVSGKSITMRLTNVSIAGATDTVELITTVDAKTLILEKSQAYDISKDIVLRQMARKTDKSQLDGRMTDVFEFTEYANKAVTRTEPYIEFRVVDFLSMMLVAAEAVSRGDLKPQDLSVFRDRSVSRAKMVFSADAPEAGQTLVKVSPPDNPSNGIVYVLAQTSEGAYYPAEIRVRTDEGTIELVGTVQ